MDEWKSLSEETATAKTLGSLKKQFHTAWEPTVLARERHDGLNNHFSFPTLCSYSSENMLQPTFFYIVKGEASNLITLTKTPVSR